MDAVTYLFGPLDGTYFCNYFLVLAIFAFTFFLASLILMIFGLFNKKANKGFFVKTFSVCLIYFIFYFQSRLLYSMCSKALN